jgi:2-amino-4-hydroxy-6-hydroxymethyldihydropteridine diphosphokinase
MRWYPAYVGVGSNLDDPQSRVAAALDALDGLPRSRLWRRSALYGSKPLGPADQPDFVNAAGGLLTELELPEFFQALRLLQQRLGHTPPPVRWGPRRIDLDLLVFAEQRLQSAELTVPHPGIVERNFVLYPLAEVAPDLIVPGLGRVADLAARASGDGIWRLEPQ